MSKPTAIRFFTIVATAAAITSCSMAPATTTTADRMRGHAADQQAEVEKKNAIAKDWDQGQKLVASGRDDLAKGEAKLTAAEADLRDGNEQVVRGRQQIEEGTRLTQSALQRFSESYPELELEAGM